MVRRSVGLTLWLVLLQLTFKSSDPACANHDTQRAEVSRHGAPDHVTPDAAHHDHESPAEEIPCEIPAQSDCCQALVSCSITLGIDARDAETASSPARFALVAAPAHAPAYLIHAPEPPPPKA